MRPLWGELIDKGNGLRHGLQYLEKFEIRAFPQASRVFTMSTTCRSRACCQLRSRKSILSYQPNAEPSIRRIHRLFTGDAANVNG